MKKYFLKIAILGLAVVMALSTLVGCGNVNWSEKVSLKNPGAVNEKTNGGFLVETENYVYFINGQADADLENGYGKPVKGALAVCEKSQLEDKTLDSVKSEIVVPKLLVSEDYDAGVSIYGDTVYFVSPSTKKTTSNSVAKDHVDLCSAKLDGSDFTVYTTVSTSSLQYRIVKSGDVVFFVYVDASTDEIHSYNTSTKENKLVSDEYTSFFFIENAYTKDVAVLYATEEEKVYNTEKYGYNTVYGYNVTTGTKTLFGEGSSVKPLQYTMIKSQNGYVYYSVTDNSISDSDLQVSYYAVETSKLFTDGFVSTKLNSKSSSYIVESTEFVAPDEIYYIETLEEGATELLNAYIVRDDLTTTVPSQNKQIIGAGNPSNIVSISDSAIYYINSDGIMLRYNRTLNRQEVVTEDKVLSDWYKQEFVTVSDKTYLFYVNTSIEGCSYVNFIDVGSAVSEKEDDDENTIYYIKKSYVDGTTVKYNQRLAGIVSESDQTLVAKDLITSLAEVISFDVDDDGNIILTDGQPTCKVVDVATARYNALTDAQKKNIDSDTVKLLENYQEAYRISKMLYKLFGFDDITKNKDDFKADFEAVNPIVEDLRVKSANKDSNAIAVLSKLVENGRWYLQQCSNYFNG